MIDGETISGATLIVPARVRGVYGISPLQVSQQRMIGDQGVERLESTTQLVVASKAGNNEALGLLLERYRGYLLMLAHRFLSARLRRRIDPADIVQTTFLEASRDLASFRGDSPAEFSSWLRGVLKNNVATAVTRHVTTQKRSLRREVEGDRPSPQDPQGLGWIQQLPGSTTSPSGVAIRAEATIALLEALHQLPETQAEAIRLRYMEGLPLAEMVERMGKSDTAVAGLLKRGLQKLRTILAQDMSPWL
ncbi:MAG: sigma-70 family RNA polymerase sigma factor [Novipirellula sp. JB048]